MAKKKENNNDFFAQLAQNTGGKLLKGMGSSRYFISTGNFALNYICSGKFMGGGFPTGITEIYGPSSSSKSLVAYTALGNCQKMGGYAICLDTERAANELFAVSAGHVNENTLIIQQPFFIEEVEQKIFSMVKFIRENKGPDAPILFVWDSISVTPCRREWQETKLPENYSTAEFKKIVGAKEQPGERAKAAGKFLRKVNAFLDDNNASLIVINQTRTAIGVMYGDPEITGGGGKALPFYANCRLRTSASKQIEDTVKKIPIGVNVKYKNKKSRSFVPFLGTEGVQLYFSKGINPLGGLLSILIAGDRIELAGKGRYKVKEPFAGGKDITFAASVVRNDIPMDVLLQCPAIVDAENEKQVKDFLGVFVEAIDLSNSDSVSEMSMEEEDINSDDGLAAEIGSMDALAEE